MLNFYARSSLSNFRVLHADPAKNFLDWCCVGQNSEVAHFGASEISVSDCAQFFEMVRLHRRHSKAIYESDFRCHSALSDVENYIIYVVFLIFQYEGSLSCNGGELLRKKNSLLGQVNTLRSNVSDDHWYYCSEQCESFKNVDESRRDGIVGGYTTCIV